jgi:hypothetical protein
MLNQLLYVRSCLKLLSRIARYLMTNALNSDFHFFVFLFLVPLVYGERLFILCIYFSPEDPWINVGTGHTACGNAMFWGENNSAVHFTFKNNNGGIKVYHRSSGNGSSAIKAAASCKHLPAGSVSGKYWIRTNGVKTSRQVYCQMGVNGGGWELFAASPSGSWFSGNSPSSWTGLSYSYGTYSPDGNAGNYWQDYSVAFYVPDEVMFATNNGKFWVSFPMSCIARVSDTPITCAVTGSSGNFGSTEHNNYVTILFRTSCW